MMYCLFSKKDEEVPEIFNDYVFYKSGNTYFIIVSDEEIHIVDNWYRVSTSKAKKFAFRDSTEWLEPHNSTLGRKKIQEIEQEWYQSFKN